VHLRQQWRGWWRRTRGCSSEDDLDRELRAHLELEAEERRNEGLSAEEARYAAARALGNPLRIKEEVRATARWASLDDLRADLRYAIRILARHRGFTSAAVLTLALGIGANTAIFSAVEAILIRPLPYSDPERLVMVWEKVDLPTYHNDRNTPAPGNFADWRDQNTVFSGIAAIRYRSFSLSGSGEPARVEGEAISASLLSILGTPPELGRGFTAEEDRPGGARVALISHGLWTERFAADPGIVGQNIRLDEQGYTVVGVMPPGFHFPDPDDEIWVPIALDSEQLANHGSHFLRVVARLRPRVTLAQANEQMALIARRLADQYPDSNKGVGVTLVGLREQTVGDVRRGLLMLFAVVGFLLLMVCANIGNLLLARASARGRELAVRAALGASRTRLLRQLLTESALLSLLGGLLGLGLASWGVSTLRGLAPDSLPRLAEIGLNRWVAAFNFGVALAAGLIAGMLPALQSTRPDVQAALKDESRGSASRSGIRLRGLLVVLQTALGVVVLVGAGLLLRSFLHLQALPLGFQPARLLSFRVILPASRYDTVPGRATFYEQLAESVAALPGVRSAAGISFLPLTFAGRTGAVTIEGQADTSSEHLQFADFRSITPGYFGTMAIPLARGRDIAWSDAEETDHVVVVSEKAAATFWPGKDPIGKRLTLGRPDSSTRWLTVVGVVGNVRQLDLTSQPRPALYLPAMQDQGTGDMIRDWIVKASGDPGSVAAGIRAEVWRIDPVLPVSRVQTMARVHATSLAPARFNLALVAFFGLLALVLAAVGLYGVTAYSVAQRTRELGIRMALGAEPRQMFRLVLGQGAVLTLAGLVIGGLVALALTRLMASLLFGVAAHDPVTFVGVAALLGTVAVLACYLPARRALRVDPTTALRYQ
jgi:putative ABC transport system permease protein